MIGPLTGIRVLDFGRYIAGPYCAMLLADFGAEVIRIERRDGGEDRYIAPITEQGEGPMFIGLNRNKKSVTLDPARPESREIKRRLIASAEDRKSTRLNSSHLGISYAVFCLKKKTNKTSIYIN